MRPFNFAEVGTLLYSCVRDTGSTPVNNIN